MKLEPGEVAIVGVQFAALVAVVVLLSTYTPGSSAQSTPVFSSVFWGTPSQGTLLHAGQLTKVSQNQSQVTATFTVAFSTQVSAVAGSRLCIGPNSTQGVSTTYDVIPFTYDHSKDSGTIPLSPAVQQPQWVCTYTIKVTDALSQTTTWLGSVEFVP